MNLYNMYQVHVHSYDHYDDTTYRPIQLYIGLYVG